MPYAMPNKALFVASFIFLSASQSALAANPYYYSQQNVLNGSSQVTASANYGKGVVFGNIDTGISPWVGFSSTYNGQGVNNIDTVNSGSCLGGTCVSGLWNTDQNGHGTFTASEIVGAVTNFDGNGNGITSVAPGGTVIGVQVLNAQGSGTLTDVANGIRYAVDHGAQVLNLSLGPGGSSSQQQAFYNGLASAVNYAASKNAYIVFAGGNSGANLVGGLKISGFTDAAIQRLLFVGATDSKKKIASYSNKPGSGSFTSTTGKSTAYKNMWIMANGGAVNWFGSITDPIWGGSNSNTGTCTGYICIVKNVGTSMAAPQGTGAIGLLIARWPVLVTNGNAAKILEQSATDLGSFGVDNIYGTGFLNLVKAFQPSGSLVANTTSGQTVTVSQNGGTSGSAVASGALGGLTHVSTALSNYTVFDAFGRDFQMNLSGLVSTRPATSAASLALSAPKISITAVRLNDGSHFAFGNAVSRNLVNVERPGNGALERNSFVSFTSADGSSFSAGNGGFSASASFAQALWGDDRASAGQAANLSASSALMNLSSGGNFFAYGTPLGKETRIAAAFSRTNETDGFSASDWAHANAQSFGAGVTHQITGYWSGGLTMNMLGEKNGLLGTTYDAAGPLHFGGNNRSVSFGATSQLAITETLSFMADASIARSDGTKLSGSIVSGTTPLYAYTAGASLVQRSAFKKGDELAFSARLPMRVYSGSADLAVSSVDAVGNTTVGTQRVSLAPDGREMAFTATYAAPISEQASWNLTAGVRRDADNIAGRNEANLLLGTTLRF